MESGKLKSGLDKGDVRKKKYKNIKKKKKGWNNYEQIITLVTLNFYFKHKSIYLKYWGILVGAIKWTIFYIGMWLLYFYL